MGRMSSLLPILAGGATLAVIAKAAPAPPPPMPRQGPVWDRGDVGARCSVPVEQDRRFFVDDWPVNSARRSLPTIIVLHSGFYSPAATRDVWISSGRDKSTHFFVGLNSYQAAPLNLVTAHCPGLNVLGVGVDICQDYQASDADRAARQGYIVSSQGRFLTLDKRVERNAAAIVASTLRALRLPLLMPEASDLGVIATPEQALSRFTVVMHCNVQANRSDVLWWWPSLRSAIAAQYNATPEP